MTSLRSLLQSARSLQQPMLSPPARYALPWDRDLLRNCFDVRIAVRNQGSHFPSLQARSHKNSAFISFLGYFRKGLSLGEETHSPKPSIFLYSSLLYSICLYPIASYEPFCNSHFAIFHLQSSYLPSPNTSTFLYSSLLFSTCLYPIATYKPICIFHLQFSLKNSYSQPCCLVRWPLDTISAMFAEIALPLNVSQTFTYRLPGHMAASARPGSRVIVPFGKKLQAAFIVAIHEDIDDELRGAIKDVQELLDETPVVHADILELTKWMADYYYAPWGECLRSALPAGTLGATEKLITVTEAGRAAIPAPGVGPGHRSAKDAALELIAKSGTI